MCKYLYFLFLSCCTKLAADICYLHLTIPSVQLITLSSSYCPKCAADSDVENSTIVAFCTSYYINRIVIVYLYLVIITLTMVDLLSVMMLQRSQVQHLRCVISQVCVIIKSAVLGWLSRIVMVWCWHICSEMLSISVFC